MGVSERKKQEKGFLTVFVKEADAVFRCTIRGAFFRFEGHWSFDQAGYAPAVLHVADIILIGFGELPVDLPLVFVLFAVSEPAVLIGVREDMILSCEPNPVTVLMQYFEQRGPRHIDEIRL